MWTKILTIKRTKDLNYFSLCALKLFNKRVSQFELNYWNKWTFPWHSNLLRCTCIQPSCLVFHLVSCFITSLPASSPASSSVMSVWENTQQLECLRNRLKITHIQTLSLFHSPFPLSLFTPPPCSSVTRTLMCWKRSFLKAQRCS